MKPSDDYNASIEHKFCLNCESPRYSRSKSGFCRKCYYWAAKKNRMARQLEALKTDNVFDRNRFRHHIAVADRVLEEYRWRERHLNATDVPPVDIEGLAHSVAACCRSTISWATLSLLHDLEPYTRKYLFLVLLEILENVPSTRPRLRLNMPEYGDGWSEWSRNLNKSKAL